MEIINQVYMDNETPYPYQVSWTTVASNHNLRHDEYAKIVFWCYDTIGPPKVDNRWNYRRLDIREDYYNNKTWTILFGFENPEHYAEFVLTWL